jgi:hypothetical protein
VKDLVEQDIEDGAEIKPPDENVVDVQIFKNDGTWTKPAGAKSVEVTIYGTGSGGGSATGEKGKNGSVMIVTKFIES